MSGKSREPSESHKCHACGQDLPKPVEWVVDARSLRVAYSQRNGLAWFFDGEEGLVVGQIRATSRSLAAAVKSYLKKPDPDRRANVDSVAVDLAATKLAGELAEEERSKGGAFSWKKGSKKRIVALACELASDALRDAKSAASPVENKGST